MYKGSFKRQNYTRCDKRLRLQLCLSLYFIKIMFDKKSTYVSKIINCIDC